MAQEKRSGPFKVMNPRKWVPDHEKTMRILKGMPDDKDQKGEKRG